MRSVKNATACLQPPAELPSDAGVAGIGVLLSFMVTAGIALTLSAALIISEWRNGRGGGSATTKRKAVSTKQGASQSWDLPTIGRKLLAAYSDQQILTGIALQSVGLAKAHSSMAPYHFFLIWMLGLLSAAVHNATLLALARDFGRDSVLRWLRQALMAASMALSMAYGVYILQAVRLGVEDGRMPIGCVWNDGFADAKDSLIDAGGIGGRRGGGKGIHNAGLSFFGTIAAMAANMTVFAVATWYLHTRARSGSSSTASSATNGGGSRYYVPVQAAGLFLMTASSAGVTARVVVMAQAFGVGNPPVAMADMGEREWSFGSLLSLGLLLLPLVNVIEIVRGEIWCVVDEEDDDDGENGDEGVGGLGLRVKEMRMVGGKGDGDSLAGREDDKIQLLEGGRLVHSVGWGAKGGPGSAGGGKSEASYSRNPFSGRY